MNPRQLCYGACLLGAALVTMLLAGPVQAQSSVSFLMVKPGDEAANPDQAAGFLSDLAAYLQEHVSRFEGMEVQGLIANREKSALDLLAAHDPMVTFVSPGFYLAHLSGADREAVPVAQLPRFGETKERYYLVAGKGQAASVEQLREKTVRTHFSPDIEYLQRIVFPEDFQPGVHFTLEPADNLADEVFMIIEGMDGGADALLLDEELRTFFEGDDLVWPDLTVIWESAPLPRDLAVALGSWSDAQRQDLREALLNMKDDPAGMELLDLMNSAGFSPVDEASLGKVVQQYGQR